MSPEQKQFHDIINEASFRFVMSDINIETGRPFTIIEKAEVMSRLSKESPQLLADEIDILQKKIDFIRAFLPREPRDAQ